MLSYNTPAAMRGTLSSNWLAKLMRKVVKVVRKVRYIFIHGLLASVWICQRNCCCRRWLKVFINDLAMLYVEYKLHSEAITVKKGQGWWRYIHIHRYAHTYIFKKHHLACIILFNISYFIFITWLLVVLYKNQVQMKMMLSIKSVIIKSIKICNNLKMA